VQNIAALFILDENPGKEDKPMTRHFEYILVGGGMAADAAARGIRQADPDRAILMIGKEDAAPYNRPPLTKGLWKNKKIESIWRHTENLGVELRLGHSVVKIDPGGKTVTDESGQEFEYGTLLLATGAMPIRIADPTGKVVHFRTINTYYKLREMAESGQEFVVVGGGYIGSEIAAALAMQGKKVTMVFPEDGISQRVFPHDMSMKVNEFYQAKGVRVLNQRLASQIGEEDGRPYVVTDRGEMLPADGIVAGLGVRPNVELAKGIGLKIGKGVQVDEHLQTSLPGIYAAGDLIDFYSSALGHYLHAEHEENANKSGELAGLSMAGQPQAYDFLPMFYSDLFELGYEAVGLVDSSLPIVGDWEEPYKKGVVYYLKEDRVVGVLLVDIWGKVDEARALIQSREIIPPADLRGRIK
jgi:3-phenylpropionate/trans-cinnamate dioxygenase ferredoxin reductase subunit